VCGTYCHRMLPYNVRLVRFFAVGPSQSLWSEVKSCGKGAVYSPTVVHSLRRNSEIWPKKELKCGELVSKLSPIFVRLQIDSDLR
jgi:hypothetical protein